MTASFGRILPSSILRLFPEMQCFNVHPSLLPAYRGPAPIQRTLMAGETETGVCIIQMGDVRPREGKVVDEGSVWALEQVVSLIYVVQTLSITLGKWWYGALPAMCYGYVLSSDHLCSSTGYTRKRDFH